ncbi:MAG: ATP-binding protein [Bacteroidota bacterium]|nr:ATP-binding protein [Bacteroidota bacterium]
MHLSEKTKRIAIASGKGGTGKTTVSVNLFHFIQKHWTQNVELSDCDVEEPNSSLFFSDSQKTQQKDSFQMIPKIDIEKCTFCRKCVEYCEFNAIVVIPPVKFAEINPSLCHSCGACSVACKFGAIEEFPVKLGEITSYETNNQNRLIEGKLEIGSAMQTLMIKELKKETDSKVEICLYDSPPGTSCPVVTTVADAHYVILVAEPTPFGLYDLKLMVELLRELKKEFGIIVNKAGIGNMDLYEYVENENINILGEIPFSRVYAENYASGNLMINIPEEIENSYVQIVNNLQKKFI